MHEIAAYSTLAVTMGLVLTRPRIAPIGIRVGPGMATAMGVAVLLLVGIVQPADVAQGLSVLWRPFLTIVSIMVTTSVAQRVGLLDYFAQLLERRLDRKSEIAGRELHPGRVFAGVFVLSALTAAAKRPSVRSRVSFDGSVPAAEQSDPA